MLAAIMPAGRRHPILGPAALAKGVGYATRGYRSRKLARLANEEASPAA
jgi:hypothetical protein